MRDSNTERIGVYKAALIFTEEIKWIFREQTVVDVGIDALIEQSLNGNPTGKFIAAQIKTGEGNFHISNTNLTHYVSKIHYNYWLNFNVPVILIAHLPIENKTYWEVLTKNTLQKTKARWKLSISKDKKLNAHSLTELTEIVTKSESHYYYSAVKLESFSEIDLERTINDLQSISQSNIALRNMVTLIDKLRDKIIDNHKIIENFVKLGLTEFDKRVLKSIKKLSEFMNNISSSLTKEINHFAEHYARGIYSYEKITLYNFHMNKNYRELQDSRDEIANLIPSTEIAINGIKILRNSISDLPSKYSHLKKSKIKFTDIADDIIDELKIAISLDEKFVSSLEEILK